MQTSDLNDNNTGSDQDAFAIFRQFQDATFSREHRSLKTLTKITFDLLQWQENRNAVTGKKAAYTSLSQQHFAGLFCLGAND